MLSDLTRLETFGRPSLHWVKATVDLAFVNVFQVQPIILRKP